MNSLQIHKILHRDPDSARYFAGVFPSDKIPTFRTFPCGIVLNTDKHNEKGTHWLAIYIQDKKTLEFFDSYGFPPDAYGNDITNFVGQYSQVSWNKITFQSPTSNVCGAYCIYYLVKRCQGFCIYSIVKHLVGKNNDFRMFQFVKRRYAVNMVFKK